MSMKSHFQIALFLALLAVKQAARVAINKIEVLLDDTITANDSTFGTPIGEFYIVQLADPQLGMLNLAKTTLLEATDFNAEANNLEQAVASILKLQPPPKVVVMSGDMQNFWSGNPENNFVLSPSKSPSLGDYGEVQANRVKELMEPLVRAGIPVKYTPGNHDLDDVSVDEYVLDRYHRLWGDDYYSFQIEDVLFMSINSQMYYRRYTDTFAREHKEKQTRWIQETLISSQNSSSPPSAIVILTHIPPFIGRYTEDGKGWANWDMSIRYEIFRLLYGGTVAPELWLCGHFHGNVHAYHRYGENKWPIDVVTTGSVGTTMLWNGTTNFYTPRHASRIAQAAAGDLAFVMHIIDGNPENIPKRLSTSKDLSGLRVVQFRPKGQYRHKWFTLNEFATVRKIDDASMAGAVPSYSEVLLSKGKSTK